MFFLFFAVALALPFDITIDQPVATHDTASVSSFSDSVSVEFVLANTGKEPLKVSIMGTPLDVDHHGQLRGNIFNISTHSGISALYLGKKSKRLSSSSTHFRIILPGQTIRKTLDLRKSYFFPAADDYRVTLQSYMSYLYGTRNIDLTVPMSVTSLKSKSSVLIHISTTGFLPPQFNPKSSAVVSDSIQTAALTDSTLTFNGCNATQRALITAAKVELGTLINRANTYFQRGCNQDISYTENFGVCDPIRFQIAKSTYINMTTRYQKGFGFDCTFSGCDSGDYSYVYPADDKHVIYLCNWFWLSPTYGCAFGSMAGVMVHELSHFFDVGATNDWGYGVDYVRWAATNDPNDAVNNADSIETFAETCPVLWSTPCDCQT